MFFNFLTSIFWFATSLFCGSAGGLARRRIFEFLDPFSDWFSSFCDSRNTGFYSVFLFSACLTASFKTSKNLVNYAVLCYGVNENIVNTSVFWRWLKKLEGVGGKITVILATWPSKTMVFAVVSASHRAKNTVNNSNFAVFFMFFRYFLNCVSPLYMAIKFFAFFFPTISTFGCFWSQWPTSLAVTTSGHEGVSPTMRCGAVAVAKRRE